MGAEADAAKTNAAKTNAAIAMVSNGKPTEVVVMTDSKETEDSFMSRLGHPSILVLLSVGFAVGILAIVLVVRARNGSRKGKKKLKTISENEIVDENENENADKINDEVPSWTSHRNEDGFLYYNNGERSTWTDHNKNGPRTRRSTLLPTPTVLQVEK